MFNFSRREINVLTFGGIFLIIFAAAQFIYSPSIEKRNTLKRVLEQKQAALEEMALLQQQFNSVSSHVEAETEMILNRKKDFSLFSFLDSQAQKSGVKGNVDYMKPATKKIEQSAYMLATVKLKLKEIHLKNLIDFLYHIEAIKNGVTITSLSLTKTGKENAKLDAVIETQTLILKDKE